MESKESMESKFQNNVVPISLATSLKPLPKILYDRGEVEEILEVFSGEIGNKLKLHIDNVEIQVLNIQGYQLKKNIENFYGTIHTALLDIHNAANAIYDDAKYENASLANSLKRLIETWTAPLQKELEKRLEMTSDDRNELELKTKWLYAEQSFVSRQTHLQTGLMDHLNQLKLLLKESNRPELRCYISYAWPSKENKNDEYWVQPFLWILYDHLTAAGIRVSMDIRDNNPGDSIYKFMERYHDGNYIILVGTESLLQKHRGIQAHAVQTELSIINDRFEQDQNQFGKSRIYPMLISSTIKTSYPEIYDKYRTVRDAREPGYIGTLKKLIDWIYEAQINKEQKIQLKYVELWQAFYKNHIGLLKELKAIEQEIAKGYHQQRLDNLRQDIQYQTVQKQVPYTFTHKTDAQTVHVAGDFNQWLNAKDGKIEGEHSEWLMKKGESGVWQLTINLAPGTYQFKYVINNGKGYEWEKDEKCQVSNDKDQNSILSIEPTNLNLNKSTSNEDKKQLVSSFRELETLKQQSPETKSILHSYKVQEKGSIINVQDSVFEDELEIETEDKTGNLAKTDFRGSTAKGKTKFSSRTSNQNFTN